MNDKKNRYILGIAGITMLALILLAGIGLVTAKGPTTAPKAYITNRNAIGFPGTVSVIDTSNNSVVATIPVGINPYGVAANIGTNVYITNSGDNTTSVIDKATNSVKATIVVGNTPLGVAASPTGPLVYVTNELDNDVSVIDTNINTVTKTIPVENHPVGIAVNPTGTRVYVANYASNDVSVIDTSTNTVIASVALPPLQINGESFQNFPLGVTVSPSGGSVYVTGSNVNNVSVIDTTTNSVTATIPVPFGVGWGVAVNPRGTNVYITGGAVGVISTKKDSVISVIPIGGLGISLNPAGTNVYVAGSGSDNVSVISTKTNTVTGTIHTGPCSPGICDPVAFGQFIG